MGLQPYRKRKDRGKNEKRMEREINKNNSEGGMRRKRIEIKKGKRKIKW
jgi:hypothetical protein